MVISNLKTKIYDIFSYFKNFGLHHKLEILAFIISFVMMFIFLNITMARSSAIRKFKSEFSHLISTLNEVKIDIAYDHIKFNSMIFHPLIEIQNLRIYSLNEEHQYGLKLSYLSSEFSVSTPHHLDFNFAPNGELVLNNFVYSMDFDKGGIALKSSPDNNIKELLFKIENSDIKDFAKIKDITFAARKFADTRNSQALVPTVESHIEFSDINLNGLLNYPLSSNIKRLYANFNLIGSLSDNSSLLLSAESWLNHGGFIEIPSFIINWKPLLMVGKGRINFDEKFAPFVQLDTSSKAFLELINDLQDNDFLDRKGVFVADILLRSQAFKLHEDDQYLTTAAPISYRDGKLAIENITVKDFNEDK